MTIAIPLPVTHAPSVTVLNLPGFSLLGKKAS